MRPIYLKYPHLIFLCFLAVSFNTLCNAKIIQTDLPPYDTNTVPVGNLPTDTKLQSLITYAWKHHPLIKAAEKQILAAKFNVSQSKQRLRSNPIVKIGVANRVSSSGWGLDVGSSLSQEITSGLRSMAEQYLAKISLEKAKQEVEYFRLRLSIDIEKYYRRLQLISIKVKVIKDLKSQLIKWVEYFQKGLEIGRFTQLEANTAMGELTKINVLESSSELQKTIIKGELLKRLLIPDNKILDNLDPLPSFSKIDKDVKSLIKYALQHRIEVVSLFNEIKEIDGKIALTKSKLFPGLKVGIRYDMENLREHIAGGFVSFPIPVFYKQTYAVKALETGQEGLKYQLKTTFRKIALEVKESLKQYQQAKELVNQYTDVIIPQFEAFKDEAKRQIDKGVSNLIALILAQRQIVDVRLDYWEALSNSWKAYLKLVEALGTRLKEDI